MGRRVMTAFMVRRLRGFLLLALLFFLSASAHAQSQVQGRVSFVAVHKTDRSAGVWIDGQYVGYVDELKGENKVLLLPGEHEISVRLAGYKSLTEKVIAESGKVLVLKVDLDKDTQAQYPAVTAELKLEVTPHRAGVFLDNAFLGHAGEFGRGVLVSPGKHRIKIVLPGYQSFETDVNLVAGQKTQIKTELVKASVTETTPPMKNP
jgi:PEGA domain